MNDYSLQLEPLNPLSDVVFSCLFQDMNAAPAMKELINAVLVSADEEPITEVIDIQSQYTQLAAYPKDKVGRLDVKVRVGEKDIFDMEVQLERNEHFVDRENFYGNTQKLSDFKSGETYKNIPRVRVIALLDFELRKNSKDIVQPIKLMYTRDPIETATEKIAYYNVEIPKFKRYYKTQEDVINEHGKNRELAKWLYIFTKGYKSKEELNMLKQNTVGTENFIDLYIKAMADNTLRRRYEYEMSCILEENSKLQDAEDKGRARGLEQGRAEGKSESLVFSLKNLLKNTDMSLPEAMAAIGIPSDERPMYEKLLGLELRKNQE